MTLDSEWFATFARAVVSRPAEARTSVDLRAEVLSPQVLPGFFARVGRIYVELGNVTDAVVMFARVRETDEAHGLSAETARKAVGFALAGPLTIKSMSKYARMLAASRTPDEALDEFLSLCVDWHKGGTPPYAAMHKEIVRLAKAAKKDLTAVVKALLAEIVFGSAADNVRLEFWQHFRTELVALVREVPAARGRLLGITPTNADVHSVWLEILIESGASAGLTEPAGSVDPQAEAPDGPAGWLTRFAASRPGRSEPLLEMVSAMAARLRADGTAVDLFSTVDSPDLDLLDLCLAERIPLVPKQNRAPFNVAGWLFDDEPGRRDLAAVTAVSDYLPFLAEGLAGYLRPRRLSQALPPDVLDRLLHTPGSRTVLRCWVEQRAEEVRGDTLFLLGKGLNELRPLRVAAAFADAPQLLEQIAATNVARVLAATLRGGIFDEFGWPALEEAVARLLEGEGEPGRYYAIEVVGEGWPALLLRRGDKVIVVGPDGILMEHVLRKPAGVHARSNGLTADFVDGRILVVWDNQDDPPAYWSDAPTEVFALSRDSGGVPPASLAMPGGGRFTGGRPLHAGDTTVAARSRVHSDGISYWRADAQGLWHEIEPSTGTVSQASLPKWIASFGAEVDGSVSWLRPVAPGTESSPLGHADGILGWRVRKEPDGSWLGERIDGVQVRLSHVHEIPLAALSFPGAAAARAVISGDSSSRTVSHQILDPAGNPLAELPDHVYRPDMARGTSFVPPLDWWCCLRVRDEAGSCALRSVTEDVARQLLDADDPAVALAQVLPEVTHPELIAGVLGMVSYARKLRKRLHVYDELAVSVTSRPDGSLHPGLSTLGLSAEQSAAVEKLVAKLPSERGIGHWGDVVANPAAFAFKATLPSCSSAADRTNLIDFLRSLADIGFEGSWREVRLVPNRPVDLGEVVPTADGFVVIGGDFRVYDDVRWGTAVQFSSGTFALPEGWRLALAEPIGRALSATQITTFCAALEANGPLEWRQGWAEELAERTGLSRGEATYLLLGLTSIYHSFNWKSVGMSTAVAANARERFRELSKNDDMALLGAGIPADPAALWTTGPDIAGIASVWVERFGRRTSVPDDLLVKAKQQLPLKQAAEFVRDAVNPGRCVWLNTDPRMSFVDGSLIPADADAFSVEHLRAMRNVLPWLAYHLPAGSPVRARLSQTFSLIRDRLRHPGFCVELHGKSKEPMDRLLNLPADMTSQEWVDVDGWLQVDATSGGGYRLLMRPSEYRLEHQEILAALPGVLARPNRWRDDKSVAEAVLVFMGPEIEQACSLVSPGLDVYYQDPTVSAPDLVETVAARYTVDSDVAALYLQILALPDPADVNVARWTGWKPARLRAARAALAATDLVVSAKRSKAGRSLFLPGGWRELDSPHLPIEVWKEPLFGLGTDPPSVVIAPVGTVERLFRQAWQRVEDGDVP